MGAVITVPFFVSWFIAGQTVFLVMAKFSSENYANEAWDRIYYLWMKAIHCMIIVLLYEKHTRYRNLLKPVFIYTLIALLWEGISWITKTDWNDTLITTTLFLAILGIILILTGKDLLKDLLPLIKKWKQNW